MLAAVPSMNITMERNSSHDKSLLLVDYSKQRAQNDTLLDDASTMEDASCQSMTLSNVFGGGKTRHNNNSKQAQTPKDEEQSQQQLQEAISKTEVLLNLPLDRAEKERYSFCGGNNRLYHSDHKPRQASRNQRPCLSADPREAFGASSLSSSGHIRRSFRNRGIANDSCNSLASLATDADESAVSLFSATSVSVTSSAPTVVTSNVRFSLRRSSHRRLSMEDSDDASVSSTVRLRKSLSTRTLDTSTGKLMMDDSIIKNDPSFRSLLQKSKSVANMESCSGSSGLSSFRSTKRRSKRSTQLPRKSNSMEGDKKTATKKAIAAIIMDGTNDEPQESSGQRNVRWASKPTPKTINVTDGGILNAYLSRHVPSGQEMMDDSSITTTTRSSRRKTPSRHLSMDSSMSDCSYRASTIRSTKSEPLMDNDDNDDDDNSLTSDISMSSRRSIRRGGSIRGLSQSEMFLCSAQQKKKKPSTSSTTLKNSQWTSSSNKKGSSLTTSTMSNTLQSSGAPKQRLPDHLQIHRTTHRASSKRLLGDGSLTDDDESEGSSIRFFASRR
ncbi:expressed unknown protein [Seminavis robusta]|uniref:Uncharacterized protein n=1 Tax=Seminavis robusta TaxID=568900 RepID=A0A9N8DXR0_9STRA|nr:expressed unknown protein [Seminavis robusta]|eukprot:Sro360_g126220.1 n/a (555) ;mRNA; f:20647-22311